MQVSKRLNLAPIAKDLTTGQRVKAYRERVQHLEKLLKRGKMGPMLTQRCEEYLRSAQFRIRQLQAPTKPVKSPAQVKKIEARARANSDRMLATLKRQILGSKGKGADMVVEIDPRTYGTEHLPTAIGFEIPAKAKAKAGKKQAAIRTALENIDQSVRKANAKAKPVNSAQGILPNFLSQLNNARIEELVAEKIYQALARGLEKQLGVSSDDEQEVG